MVEHLLAALSGLRIDNCEIHVSAAEMPGLDGSCLEVAQSLRLAGIREQDAIRRAITIRDITRVGDEQGWVEIRPNRQPGLRIHYHLDYGRDNPIGRQKFDIQLTEDRFLKKVAPARTFLLHREAAWLREQGIGKHVTYNDLLVFDDNGPVDNQLRFDDECVRHKVLDLIGDFALAGCDLNGYVTAYKSGHRLNSELVRVLLREYAAELLEAERRGTLRKMG
jgi:UDP-3-O-acyl N-acetylglucosamine deacetylase